MHISMVTISLAHLAFMSMRLCNHELSHVASCIIIIGIIVCGQSLQPQVWSQKLHILHIYVHMSLVYAHALVSKYK